MDLSSTIAPKSDQLNADDMIAAPRTFTIEKVTQGNAEQPVNIYLTESPGRPWKPSKSMRRVLVAAWGPDGNTYAGRHVTLYRNPDIKFGGEAVGGIEISHMTDLPKPLKLALTVTRGKKRAHTVQPLTTPEPTFTVPKLPTADAYREHWKTRGKEGASRQELDAIRAAAATVPDQAPDPTSEPDAPTPEPEHLPEFDTIDGQEN